MNKKSAITCSVIYFCMMILFLTLRMLSAYGCFSFISNDTVQDVVFSMIIQVGIMLLPPIFVFSKVNNKPIKTTLKEYGFKKINSRQVFYCFLLGICVFFVNVFVSSFFNNIISLFGYESSSSVTTSYPFWQFCVDVVISAILPAICEEVAHRGMLKSEFLMYGHKTSIILSGVMFGLMHMNIEQVFYAILIGIFFGYVADKSRSIYPTMILHFMNNFLSCFFSYASINNFSVFNFYSALSNIANQSVLLYFILIVGLVVVCINFGKYCLKQVAPIEKNLQEYEKIRQDYVRKTRLLSDIKAEKQSAGLNTEEIDKIIADENDKMYYTLKNLKGTAIKPQKMHSMTKSFVILVIVVQTLVTVFTFFWGML